MIQLSVNVRDARLDVIEATIGATATLRVRTGAQPINCAASRSGTVVASITLPSDWMLAASGGAKAMSGTWADTSADAAGTAGHFEIVDGSNVCHLQGSVSLTGGGGDMTLDNVVFAIGQTFSVTSFSLTDANA